MKPRFEELLAIAKGIREKVLSSSGTLKGRDVTGKSHGGDTQFDVDDIAENEAKRLAALLIPDAAIYAEDYIQIDENKPLLLVIDPIDGTRSAAAGLEMATISIALAENVINAELSNVVEAIVLELKTGAWVYADKASDGIKTGGFQHPVPNINPIPNYEKMFWSIEFNGHPSALMTKAYGHIIDMTSNSGGVFVFSSSTYSILKIITGQMDAYADIGNRLLRDNPALEPEFKRVGLGSVLHLFPYDIAAIVLIAEKAGVIITDAYGESLMSTRLCESQWMNQKSCIAAASSDLHKKLMSGIMWGEN